MSIDVAEIIIDLDARFPDAGSLNTIQVMEYFGVCRPTADAWMKTHAKNVGDKRIPKIMLAKWLVSTKTK